MKNYKPMILLFAATGMSVILGLPEIQSRSIWEHLHGYIIPTTAAHFAIAGIALTWILSLVWYVSSFVSWLDYNKKVESKKDIGAKKLKKQLGLELTWIEKIFYDFAEYESYRTSKAENPRTKRS